MTCLMEILTRRTASDKILHGKAFNFAKNPKFDGYQCGLASMVYNLFDNKSASLARSENLRLKTLSRQLRQINLLPVEQLKMKLCLIKN